MHSSQFFGTNTSEFSTNDFSLDNVVDDGVLGPAYILFPFQDPLKLDVDSWTEYTILLTESRFMGNNSKPFIFEK